MSLKSGLTVLIRGGSRGKALSNASWPLSIAGSSSAAPGGYQCNDVPGLVVVRPSTASLVLRPAGCASSSAASGVQRL